MLSQRASVPLPKFVESLLQAMTNFGSDKNTSKLMFLVWFSDLKFASELAANDVANVKSTTLDERDQPPRAIMTWALKSVTAVADQSNALMREPQPRDPAMSLRNSRHGRTTARRRRLMVRLALAAALVALIIVRYTSPRSLFHPTSNSESIPQPR